MFGVDWIFHLHEKIGGVLNEKLSVSVCSVKSTFNQFVEILRNRVIGKAKYFYMIYIYVYICTSVQDIMTGSIS